jgi:hypothetical protein
MQLQQGFVTRGTGFSDRFALQKFRLAHVRFGSKADIGAYSINVCFTSKSGHWFRRVAMSALCQKQTHALQQKKHVIQSLYLLWRALFLVPKYQALWRS